MKTKHQNTILVSTFLWIGFVSAISFLEAWIKFRAPGVTLALGLGIGKLVFGALNKVEWVFTLIIAIALLASKSFTLKGKNMLYLTAILVLIVQTIWLLPALNARADLYITNSNIPPSNIHYYYVGIEFVKVIALFIFGKSFLNKFNQNKPNAI